jgi:hypothetical protein
MKNQNILLSALVAGIALGTIARADDQAAPEKTAEKNKCNGEKNSCKGDKATANKDEAKGSSGKNAQKAGADKNGCGGKNGCGEKKK